MEISELYIGQALYAMNSNGEIWVRVMSITLDKKKFTGKVLKSSGLRATTQTVGHISHQFDPFGFSKSVDFSDNHITVGDYVYSLKGSKGLVLSEKPYDFLEVECIETCRESFWRLNEIYQPEREKLSLYPRQKHAVEKASKFKPTDIVSSNFDNETYVVYVTRTYGDSFDGVILMSTNESIYKEGAYDGDFDMKKYDLTNKKINLVNK